MYLSPAEFAEVTLLPTTQLATLNERYPGWLKLQLTRRSGFIDSQLIKRYAVPFVAPYPHIALDWLEAMVTLRCSLKVGVSPTDEQFIAIKELSEKAEREIQEAANSVAGLFELPLRGAAQDGIVKGGPLSYSEQSPYVGMIEQARIGRAQDERGRGD